MPVSTNRTGTEQPTSESQSSFAAHCPICGSAFVELRSTLRCSRCYFSICEGCVSEPNETLAIAND